MRIEVMIRPGKMTVMRAQHRGWGKGLGQGAVARGWGNVIETRLINV
jgi:hypothetical protein